MSFCLSGLVRNAGCQNKVLIQRYFFTCFPCILGKNTPSLHFLLCKYSELWSTYLEGILVLSITCHIYPEFWQNTHFDLFPLLMAGTCRAGYAWSP